MARNRRVVSGDRINFSGIYDGSRRSSARSNFIEVTKDPYFVAIGGDDQTGTYAVDPLRILDFCALMALFFLVMCLIGMSAK